MQDTRTPSHRIVRFNCEDHSNHDYVGDFTDDEFRKFLLELQDTIDVEKKPQTYKVLWIFTPFHYH